MPCLENIVKSQLTVQFVGMAEAYLDSTTISDNMSIVFIDFYLWYPPADAGQTVPLDFKGNLTIYVVHKLFIIFSLLL